MAEDSPITADQIAKNAAAPQSVTGDQGSMTQHSLPDQIAADEYRRRNLAANRRGMGGIRFVKFVPPSPGDSV